MPNFVAPMIGRGVVLQTPAADGTSGQIIQTNGSGTLSFVDPATGNVTKVGTPADNQVGVWTGDGTIEGTSELTYTGATFAVTAALSPSVECIDTTNTCRMAVQAQDSVGRIGSISNHAFGIYSSNLVSQWITTTQRTGFGTTGPAGKVEINSTTASLTVLVLQTTDDSATQNILDCQNAAGASQVAVSGNGKLNLSASTTGRATLNIPSGTAPTSPVNGDIWSDGSDIKVRLGGTTYTLNKT